MVVSLSCPPQQSCFFARTVSNENKYEMMSEDDQQVTTTTEVVEFHGSVQGRTFTLVTFGRNGEDGNDKHASGKKKVHMPKPISPPLFISVCDNRANKI
jgi:hypothetical protein